MPTTTPAHQSRTHHPGIHRHGLTLIEALIATGLGLVLTYTAYAGLRVATQATATANRLSLENGLMRAGYFAALHECDWWHLYDHPTDPGRQRLRGFDANRQRGLPFTPFPQRWPRALAMVAGSEAPPSAESERGWDPTYTWPASDARTWFHGNLCEIVGSGHKFGRYELYSHLKPAITLTSGSTPFGAAEPLHTWLPNQMESLKNNLGYYGACDYMPSGTIFATYGMSATGPFAGTTPPDDGWSKEWLGVGPNSRESPWTFSPEEGGSRIPRGVYGKTNNAPFALVPGCPGTALSGATVARLVEANASYFPVGQYSDAVQMQNYRDKAMAITPLLEIRPEAWPDLSVGIMRFVGWRRITTSCRVRWFSPLTGETVELTFSAFTTTLRGARQARRLSSDPTSPDHDINLDGGSIRALTRIDRSR